MSGSVSRARRSSLDGVVRWLLRVEHAEPRALWSLGGSMVLSALRCLVTYVVVPMAVPVLGWMGGVATPLSLVLSLAAVALAVDNLRRVWIADWRWRWAYTGFSGVVIVALGAVVGLDLRAVVG